MRIYPASFLGVIAAIAFGVSDGLPSGWVNAGDSYSEEFEQTYPLNAEGQVSVATINGSVTVTVWERDEVKLHAVKTADRQEDLDRMQVEVAAGSSHLEIKTQFAKSLKQKKLSGRIDYRLTVPVHVRLDKVNCVGGAVDIEGAKGRVVASTVNGRLNVRGLAGQVSLSTVDGTIEAEFSTWEGVDSVSATCVNGRVVLRLPHDVNADLNVTALNGSLGTDFDLQVKKNRPVGSELKGKLGAGGTPVKVNTVNGSVRVNGLG